MEFEKRPNRNNPEAIYSTMCWKAKVLQAETNVFFVSYYLYNSQKNAKKGKSDTKI